MTGLIGTGSSSFRRFGLLLWAVLGFIGAGTALAHHSFAMYDSDHQVKLAGTVTSFEWNNPHVYIALASSDEHGDTRGYTVECASPGIRYLTAIPVQRDSQLAQRALRESLNQGRRKARQGAA